MDMSVPDCVQYDVRFFLHPLNKKHFLFLWLTADVMTTMQVIRSRSDFWPDISASA